MKRLIIAATLAGAVLTSSALAQDFSVGSIKISKPWARATPDGAQVGGGFLTITNSGKEADRLVGGSSSVAGKLEVHEMAMEGDVMKMRALKSGMEIKPGDTVTLKPGGYHVMFMELKQPLKAGEKFKGTLEFEKAGKVDVEYTVEAVGAGGSGSSGGHGGHK